MTATIAEGLAFLPRRQRLATGGIAGTVTIWDIPIAVAVSRLRYSEPIWATAVSPDGTLIAVLRHADGARDSTVEVRDLRSGKPLYTRTISPDSAFYPVLSFSGDGRTLVASGCCSRPVDGGRLGRTVGCATIPPHDRAKRHDVRVLAGRSDTGRRHRRRDT